MRILKYLLLIALLLLVGLTVFVATQSPDFKVSKFRIIKTPRAIVFNYVNDFRNWETFVNFDDDSKKYKYPENTIGKGASYSWKSIKNDGYIQTLALKDNETISQKSVNNGSKQTVNWKFKDTIGGTKVTWQSEGKIDFKYKVLYFFQGGINKVLADNYELGLENLNKTLLFELNTFSIKVNGNVKQDSVFYLKKTITCREKSVRKNTTILFSKLDNYLSKKEIKPSGNRFVIYHKYDTKTDIVTLSVCIPMKDSIKVNPKTDIQFVYLPKYNAVKTTLKGDYSHTQLAWRRTFNYITTNKLLRNPLGEVIEVYKKDRLESKRPSEWITEIYVPTLLKPIYKKVRRPEGDTTREPTDIIPEEKKSEEEFNI